MELLLGIGLDYLNFNRRSGTLSGGESQRIRLSTQIGSGLMGMLYVLDEPSIGLHPKDNVKMIATLESLRDIGNTVIVVEHDEDTIRAADHVVEMGPGPGVHGGTVVVQGDLKDIGVQGIADRAVSLRQTIDCDADAAPQGQRQGADRSGCAREQSANHRRDVSSWTLIAITGASGSGKSTLINEILYKALWKRLVDTRTLPGDHDALKAPNMSKVVNIDQSPIGRNSRSNPATYIGFYDNIRDLFARAPLSVERGVQGGTVQLQREGRPLRGVSGRGPITTQLYFMPDVEVTCGACKGARFNSETLEVTLRGKTITDVLNMPIEEAWSSSRMTRWLARRSKCWPISGLGYLTLGQSATTLSGGEAQRIKIAAELASSSGRNTRCTFSTSRRRVCIWPISSDCSTVCTGWSMRVTRCS